MTTKKQEVRKVPNLRFSGFEGEWERKKIGEVVDFKVTNSFSRENLNYEVGTVKNIHYGDIHTKFQTLFDITKEQVPFVNENIFIGRISEDNYCKEGDIIFADASENLDDVGKSIEIVNLNNEKLLSGLHTLLARPKENLFYKGFSGYLFRSNNVRLKIQKEAQGSKVLSISTSRMTNIELTFPTLNEQQKMVSFLSLIDERIQCQIKIIDRLETSMRFFRERIFKQLIRFKNEIENVHPDWKVKKLGEIVSIQGGYAFKSEKFNNGEIKVFRIGDIVPYITIKSFTGVYSSESPNEKYIVRKNDFLMALSGATFGKVGKIHDNSIGYINQRVATFRTTQCLDFFYHLVQTDSFKSYINSIPTASAQPNISNDDIGNYITMIPSVEEQIQIASFLSSIDEKIEIEKQILDQYKNQKGYLLQNMFI